MILKILSFILNILCIFVIKFNTVSSDDIPAMLWNVKGNALMIKPISALGDDNSVFTESLKDILHQDGNLIVFAVNELSLEDFHPRENQPSVNNTLSNIEKFLDAQPHMILQSVTNPLNYIHQAHCGVQEIVVDNKIDQNILQSISKALQKSCVVILHISNKGIVPKEDQIMSVFSPSLGITHKNIVGIFTGVKSSLGDLEHHISRNLLAINSENPNFMNYTGCMIMYASNISVSVGGEANGTSLPFPPKLDGSNCNSSVLQLTFEPTGSISSVILMFDFEVVGNSWVAKKITVSVTTDKKEFKDIELNSEVIDAAIGFSYSCGNLVLSEKNNTNGIKVELVGFQVQPYEVNDKFSESFDCVPFFTIPIWMGIFVGILFILILELGIYALFTVHTMDRFDDPKGKSISVANTD